MWPGVRHAIQVAAPAERRNGRKTTRVFVIATLSSMLDVVTEQSEWERAMMQVLSGQEELRLSRKQRGNV